MKFKLVNNEGQEITKGTSVRCFRGEEHTVVGYAPPRHSASTGRVIVKTKEGNQREFFPSVFDLRIEAEEVKNGN